MRTGVVFRPQSPPEQLRAAVEAADAAGIDELWLWEDCFLEGGLTTAAAALAWSERVQVGIGLLPVPLRNPAITAMEIATLARLFPGRFLPALGHGVLDWMGQVGARVESPMTLLREHVGAIRRLLHGEQVSVEGRYVHLDGVALDWPPAEVPPVLVGARGPKTIALAAEAADGVLLDRQVTVDGVRAVAAGTTGRVIVYVQVDARASGLAATVKARVAELSDAGADTVVFHATAEAPDPAPLIEALRRS